MLRNWGRQCRIGNVARIAWALSDQVRLSVMQVLMGGPAAVAELVSATGHRSQRLQPSEGFEGAGIGEERAAW